MKKVIAILMIAALLCTALAACGTKADPPAQTPSETPSEAPSEAPEETPSTTPSETPAADGLVFGFTEWISCAFFDAVYKSLEEVVTANGGTIIHSEGQADATYQLSVIEDFIAQGVDAVFYNPVDTDASAVALQLLEEAGIPVINFDSAVSDMSKVVAYVATDNYKAGQLCGEKMLVDFPDGGEVAVLDYPANTAAVERAQGFLDAIEGSNLTVVAQLDGQGSTETSLSQAEDILQAHPNLIAFFGINDDAGLGAYAACTAANEDVKIYSVNGSPEAKEKIAEGGIYVATAAQSVSGIGRESAEVAYKYFNGEAFDHDIAIDPFIIDASNIETYIQSEWQ